MEERDTNREQRNAGRKFHPGIRSFCVVIQASIDAKVREGTEWMVEAGSPNRKYWKVDHAHWCVKHRDGRAELYLPIATPKTSVPTRLFLSTSISSSTMPTNHHFLKPFSSLKKAITRSRSRTPQSADIASNDLARPSSDPPILMTPSSTIHAVDIAMPVASKMPFNLSAPKWISITHQIKFAGDHGQVPGEGVIEWSQQVSPTPNGPHQPQTSIIHHWWLWYRFPEVSLAYFSTNCTCSECRPGISGYWTDLGLWDTCQPVCYKVDTDLHQFQYHSWSGWRPCARSSWFLGTAFSNLDWFMLASNLYILFLITLYRPSKFWLAYLSANSICSECRSDAC